MYKKKPGHAPQSYYQPPEPWTGVRDDTDILEDTAPKLRKANYTRSMHAIDTEAQDPIMELQAMAKSTSDMNEDDPPFNFQAMLKKTPRNRASMKRSNELGNDLEEKRTVAKHIISPSKAKPPVAPKLPPATPLPSKPPPTPPPSKPPAPTPPPSRVTPSPQRSSSREFMRQNSKDLIIAALKKRDSQNDLICSVDDKNEICSIDNKKEICSVDTKNETSSVDTKDELYSVDTKNEICSVDNKMENEKVELAPGFTVEGTVTDL